MHAQLRRNYKIGFLLPYLAAAGGVRRNFELANRLSELGHEVAIYSDSTQEQWFPLKVRVFKLSELQNSTDAIFTGWPLFEEKIYNFIRAEKKFWLMQGYVPEYDTRFIIDPQFVKIAASSYLYKTAEKLGVKAYKCIGAVNFDHFYPVKVERKNFALYNPLKNGKIIEEMCGRLGLEIKPLFNIKQEYLKYIYSCATMYIAAEFESSGWSNPTAEAMACKCPIISTVTGSVGDLVIEGETGLYFGLDNFESFKNSINLVTDQTQREKMVEKAFLHVKQFSWDKLVQKLDFIIQLELNKDFNQESILWQQNL